MAIVYATKSGNWSDATVWNTGSLPTTADDVRSNNFTVTVDGSYTVLTVSNRTEASPVVAAGGTFDLTNGITLTATATTGVIGGNASLPAVRCPLTSPNAASLVANAIGGSTTNFVAVSNTNTGTLTISGNITAGTGAGSHGVTNASSGVINVIGNSINNTGNPGGNVYAVLNNASGTINCTGNVFASNSAGGTSNCSGVVNASNGFINITGTVTGGNGSSISNGVVNSSSGQIVATGTVSGGGGSGLNYTGISNSSSGIVRHIGSAQASSTAAAVSNTSTSGAAILTGPFIAAANGTHAIQCARWLWSNTVPASYMEVRVSTSLALRNLYTSDNVGGNPAASNVRFGTVYGPDAGQITGTCRIPPASQVRAGVAVDNTVGTAALTAAQFWDYARSSATTAGSIGERVKNVATNDSVGAIVAGLS